MEISGSLSPFTSTASARYAAAIRDAALTRPRPEAEEPVDDRPDERPARLIDVYA